MPSAETRSTSASRIPRGRCSFARLRSGFARRMRGAGCTEEATISCNIDRPTHGLLVVLATKELAHPCAHNPSIISVTLSLYTATKAQQLPHARAGEMSDM